jgi:tetratricopeptide (TPR) repeat protein
MEAKQWEEAARDFERSVAISPQLAPIHHMLGEAYSNGGRYQDALAQFDAAIAIKADDNRYHFGKGLALKRLQRNAEAREEWVLSCKLNNFAACLLTSAPQTHKP